MTAILKRIQLLWAIITHKEAPWTVKAILIIGLFYIIFPADILPDYILLAGWVDDLILAVFMFFMAMKFTPEELLQKLWKKIHHNKSS